MAPSFPLRLIPPETKLRFMHYRWVWFAITIALTLATLALLATRGLNFGIDFTGGILVNIKPASISSDLGPLRQAMEKGEFGEVSLQQFGTQGEIMIRIQAAPDADQAAIVGRVKEIVGSVYAQATPPGVEFRQIDYVGPTVGAELKKNGILAVALSFLAIMAYVWFRFEWQFGVGGMIALLHDAILTLGFFSITGFEFSLSSVAAILTVVGYSINDSVVIYDRVRENMRKYKQMALSELIDRSLNETLSRTLLTAGTTLVAALALALFGGDVIKGFSWSLFFGVLVGTYSSIYISAPVLIFFGVRREAMLAPAPGRA